jgi:hypothetical protein
LFVQIVYSYLIPFGLVYYHLEVSPLVERETDRSSEVVLVVGGRVEVHSNVVRVRIPQCKHSSQFEYVVVGIAIVGT